MISAGIVIDPAIHHGIQSTISLLTQYKTVIMLVAAGVGAAFVSDWFVGALTPAITILHISPAFTGLVIVALVMILLPLLFLAMIGAAGWLTCYWATHFTFIMRPGGGFRVMMLKAPSWMRRIVP